MTRSADAIAVFRSPEICTVLRDALVALGIPAEDLTASLHKLHHRPGLDVSAGFDVSYQRGGRAASDYLVATTATLPDGNSAVRLPIPGGELAVWRHPADPHLPGLAPACDADVAARWVDADQLDVHITSYRPLRRAVLRYTAPTRVLFAKVVRPSRLADLAHRQDIVAEAQLGPAVLANPTPGVLLLAAANGRSLATVLSAALAGRGTMPDPAMLIELLDRLPSEVLSLAPHAAWADRLDFHGAAAAAAMPERRDEVTAFARRVRKLVAQGPLGPLVPTHGDFYEANIFVADGRPAQVIDVDAVGPGRREDDLACLLGHLAVLPSLSPDHFGGLAPVIDTWAEEFERRVPFPKALRARVAAVILSLVSGAAKSQQEPRLLAAQQWYRRATRG